jgi:quercetin dioxygenase-like cupin family protein
MEIKYNEATHNRPGGDRVLDAPFVFSDLEKYTRQLKEEEAWEKNDRNSITIFKTSGFTIVLTCLHKDAGILKNLMDGLLTIQVLDGSIDFEIDTVMTLSKNQMITLHPGIEHSITAKEDAVILITNRVVENTAFVPEND